MKKDHIRLLAGLAIGLVLYILVVFLVPFVKTPVFWASFLFTLVAFPIVGAAFYIAFLIKPDARSKFYGFPIARIGAIYGAAQLIASFLFMALGQWIPTWVAVIVYAIGLGATALGLISAEAVLEQIETQDVQLKKDVKLMRSLQSKVSQMISLCSEDPDLAKMVREFAEEMRYSDPVSNDAIADAEADLAAAVDELHSALVDGDKASARTLCRKAAALLAERNRLCKLNKGNG